MGQQHKAKGKNRRKEKSTSQELADAHTLLLLLVFVVDWLLIR